jgi:hypothetical protein
MRPKQDEFVFLLELYRHGIKITMRPKQELNMISILALYQHGNQRPP